MTGGRVLAIDDDPLVSAVFATHARAAGYEVKVTADAGEFLDTAREWEPDVVVVDLVMAEVDGIEVLRRLTANGSSATVIVTSGMGAKVLEAAQHFAAASGLAYGGLLTKPFRRSDVVEVLKSKPKHAAPKDEASDVVSEWDAAELEWELRHAIEEGHLWVAYQPKVSCLDGKLVGFEALARWQHPELGAISPAGFIPRAEQFGLMSIVTQTIAAQALAWFSRRTASAKQRLALNLSAAELSDTGIVNQLSQACGVASVPPDRVILELTETSALADTAEPLANLTRLRLDGFNLSIDDFGTGYSSLSQLSTMPFTEVKIDRSFVHNLGNSLPADVMVRSMLQLTRGLGLESTAEGVENAQALRVLSDMGCDFAQGFHIARPMAGDVVDGWLLSQGVA